MQTENEHCVFKMMNILATVLVATKSCFISDNLFIA